MAKMSAAPNCLEQRNLALRAGTREVYFLICLGKIYLIAKCARLFGSLGVPIHKNVSVPEKSIAHFGDHCWSMTSVPGGGANRNKARLAGTSRSMWSNSNSIVLWSGRFTTRRRISNWGLITISTC